MITLMFHSAGLDNYQWRSRYISEPVWLLDIQLKAISEMNLKTVFFQEAYSKRHDPNYIFLNFDDGYLDNWVHVLPLLQKYSLKATIFVSPDFVNPENIIRHKKTYTQPECRHNPEQCCAGFLSWSEMRKMEETGLIEIQSHSLTHTWYFKGPEIVDFWHPGSATETGGPVWMLWNKYPEKKPYYLTEANKLENGIPYGTPIYEHGKSLETKRYYPDDKALAEKLTRFVKDHGNEKFFLDKNWKEKLLSLTANHENRPGRYEDETEYLERIKRELEESKNLIEFNLNKKVEGICWPGGGVSDKVISAAKDIGYKYFTLPGKFNNKIDRKKYDFMLPRVGIPQKMVIKKQSFSYLKPYEFKSFIRAREGSTLYKLLFRLFQLSAILRLRKNRKMKESYKYDEK